MSVLIVSFNTREHLKACLQTVVEEKPVELFVVDNGSTDGSSNMVQMNSRW
jgi:GT2 family glycosyltransferase